jgi:hypothetical protein
MKRAVAFCQVIERQPQGAKVHKVAPRTSPACSRPVVEAYQASERRRPRARVAPALRGRARRRQHERHPEGGEDRLAQGRGAGRHLPHPEQRALPLRGRRRARARRGAVPDPAQLAGRRGAVGGPRHAQRAGQEARLHRLPVVIPAGIEPHEALNDNQTYKVVWQVLQALRSHDDRFDAMVNKLDLTGADPEDGGHRRHRQGRLGARRPGQGRAWPARREGRRPATGAPSATADRRDRPSSRSSRSRSARSSGPSTRSSCRRWATATTGRTGRRTSPRSPAPTSTASPASWRTRRTRASARRSTRSRRAARRPERQHHRRRDHRDAGPAPGDQAVFDALFAGHSFATENPMSKAMQGVLDVLARAPASTRRRARSRPSTTR